MRQKGVVDGYEFQSFTDSGELGSDRTLSSPFFCLV